MWDGEIKKERMRKNKVKKGRDKRKGMCEIEKKVEGIKIQYMENGKSRGTDSTQSGCLLKHQWGCHGRPWHPNLRLLLFESVLIHRPERSSKCSNLSVLYTSLPKDFIFSVGKNVSWSKGDQTSHSHSPFKIKKLFLLLCLWSSVWSDMMFVYSCCLFSSYLFKRFFTVSLGNLSTSSASFPCKFNRGLIFDLFFFSPEKHWFSAPATSLHLVMKLLLLLSK